MRIKGPNPADVLPPVGDPTLAAFLQAMHLKRLYRQGWLKRGVAESDCESVADHTFGVALLALLAPAPSAPAAHHSGGAVPSAADTPFAPAGAAFTGAAESLDRGHAVLLALAHELGEVYAGDITPVDGISKAEKSRMERESMERVISSLDPRTAASVRALWEEFETGSSPEARFVRELDRLEMGIQAAVFKAEGRPRMDEFLRSADRSVKSPALRSVLRAAEAASDIAR